MVYLVADDSLPLVEIAVALRAGSLLDPPDLTGLGSLTGAMIRRSGVGDLDAAAFDRAVDDLGARMDTSAGITRGGASLSVLSTRLDPALELFFDMLGRPAFQEERLAHARQNLIESMRRRDQDPLGVLEREWEWLLYGSEHFSTRPLTEASVARLERDLLVTHYGRHWRPERMLVAVSGDYSEAALLARLEEGFAGWPEAPPRAGEVPAWPPEAPPPGAAPGLYHPDRPALALTAAILGGDGAISRLGGRLRTAEGFVYRVSAAIEPGGLWPEEIRIFFDAAPATVAPALRAALEEIERLRDQPVHPMELEIARRTLLSRLFLDLDTAEKVAGRAAENELLGRSADYWETFRRGLEAVRIEDVRRVARETLDPRRFVYLLVGPWAELSQAAPPGESALEKVVDPSVRHLPRRDPLTLEPVVASAPEDP